MYAVHRAAAQNTLCNAQLHKGGAHPGTGAHHHVSNPTKRKSSDVAGICHSGETLWGAQYHPK